MKFKLPYFASASHMVGHAASPIRTVYVDVTLTRSKVIGLLNFRQLAMPCMLAAMTATPLQSFLVPSSLGCVLYKCAYYIRIFTAFEIHVLFAYSLYNLYGSTIKIELSTKIVYGPVLKTT